MNETVDCCKACAELRNRVEALEEFIRQKSKKSRPKDLLEVIEYFKSQNIKDSELKAEEFFNWYECRNWMSGKTKISDWKKCVKTWKLEKNNAKPIQMNTQSRFVI